MVLHTKRSNLQASMGLVNSMNGSFSPYAIIDGIECLEKYQWSKEKFAEPTLLLVLDSTGAVNI